MRIALACLVLAACTRPTPPPAKPPSQQVVRTPVTDVPTCADMGPLLRGPMDDEDVEGPKKESLIVASCERDKWPLAVLECAASATEPTVHDCLERLPAEMHARYERALAPYASVAEHDPPPPEEETSCKDAFDATGADAWPPTVTAEAERALAAKLRGNPLEKQCEAQQWDLASRKCIAITPVGGIEACLDGLAAPFRADVERTIKEADELRAKIVKAGTKPANVTCAKVVAMHYGPAKWTGKAPELKGAERTKVIAASKKALLRACTMWTVEARACVVAVDSDTCTALGALGTWWGYPASIARTFPPTGIAECDEYGAAVVALAGCDAIGEVTRITMLDSFRQAADAWNGLPAEGIEAARTACRSARDATRQALQACN